MQVTKIQFKIGETKERIYWPMNWEGKFLMAKEIFIFILPSSLCLFLPLCLPSFILLQSLFPSVKNICVFLKFKCGNPNAQFDSIWRWLGLDEVMRVPPSRSWDLCIYSQRKTEQVFVSLHHMRTQQEGAHLQPKERYLTRHQTYQHLDLGLPRLQTNEK